MTPDNHPIRRKSRVLGTPDEGVRGSMAGLLLRPQFQPR